MSSCDKALISALPDEILQRIFTLLTNHYSAVHVLRFLSGVCKRWQALLIDPKGEPMLTHRTLVFNANFYGNVFWHVSAGDMLNHLQLPWHCDNFEAAACGAWVQRHMQTGALHWPLDILSVDNTEIDDENPPPKKSEVWCPLTSSVSAPVALTSHTTGAATIACLCVNTSMRVRVVEM